MSGRSAPVAVLILLVSGGAAIYGFYRFKTHQVSVDPTAGAFVGRMPGQQDGGGQDTAKDADPSVGIELMPFDGNILDAAGTRDFGNRYLSTVIVSVQEPLKGADCSGVILGPRHVLTAAHCVCKKPPLSSDGGESAVSVRPHPEFKMVFGQDGTSLSVNADLAIIVLNNPLKEKLPAMPIAEEELQRQETLVMAGYGHGEEWGEGHYRYFRSNKVVGPEGSSKDRFLYEQQGTYL